MSKPQKVYVVMDNNDSWGEPEPHGVFCSMESARKSLKVDEDIIDIYLGVQFEGGDINSVSEEIMDRVFGNHHRKGKVSDAYDSLDYLSKEQRAMAEKIANLCIQETELFLDKV